MQDEASSAAFAPARPNHGVRYPPALLSTGADDRLEPSHSLEMTARLRVAQAGGAPVRLRASDTSGHGRDTSPSEEVAERTDVHALLLTHLGVERGDQPAKQRMKRAKPSR